MQIAHELQCQIVKWGVGWQMTKVSHYVYMKHSAVQKWSEGIGYVHEKIWLSCNGSEKSNNVRSNTQAFTSVWFNFFNIFVDFF